MATFSVIPQKEYEYRVFDADYNFIGIWDNVSSDFSYSQAINQNASELNVELPRTPDNTALQLEVLQDTTGANIVDENGFDIYAQTETVNAVGTDSDVELNYNVDVYAFYGGFDELLDTSGVVITDENGNAITATFGEPNGKRVYSGYIADYELLYGEKSGVKVVIVPHATEMDHYIFQSSGATTLAYTSADPVTMARDAMFQYQLQGGVVAYDSSSMPLSGQVISYQFKLQTIREVQDKVIDLLPSGYYHYVDPGEAKQYLLQKGTSANHTFILGKHISKLSLRKSITQLVNNVYYTGGDTGSGVDLFVHTVDTASIAAYRPGLDRKSDSRVTITGSATLLSQQEIDEYNAPRYRTSVVISDGVYDIETIKLGQMVGFSNFGTFVDSLLLQVVNLNRAKHTVTIDLDMVVPTDTKRLYELKKELLAEQVRDIPAFAS